MKKLAEWNTLALIEGQVSFYREEGTDLDDQELFSLVCEDTDFFTREWENLCENLTDLMHSEDWHCEASNMGWRKLSGHKYFSASSGKDFLRQILPDCDCQFKVHEYGKGLAVNNFHHDAPTGEWYYATPVDRCPVCDEYFRDGVTHGEHTYCSGKCAWKDGWEEK